MKRKRFTEEQIISALKQSERGQETKDICRQIGVTQTTFYRWKAKYGGLEVSDARKMKSLEDENRKLKKLVADLSLDNMVLRDVNSKKW